MGLITKTSLKWKDVCLLSGDGFIQSMLICFSGALLLWEPAAIPLRLGRGQPERRKAHCSSTPGLQVQVGLNATMSLVRGSRNDSHTGSEPRLPRSWLTVGCGSVTLCTVEAQGEELRAPSPISRWASRNGGTPAQCRALSTTPAKLFIHY